MHGVDDMSWSRFSGEVRVCCLLDSKVTMVDRYCSLNLRGLLRLTYIADERAMRIGGLSSSSSDGVCRRSSMRDLKVEYIPCPLLNSSAGPFHDVRTFQDE